MDTKRCIILRFPVPPANVSCGGNLDPDRFPPDAAVVGWACSGGYFMLKVWSSEYDPVPEGQPYPVRELEEFALGGVR